MPITFGGLASGLDSQSIITALVKAEHVTIDINQQKQDGITKAQGDISSFMATVTALGTAASTLSDPGQYASLAATSSDTGVSVSANGGAVPGSYSVQVKSLAAEQRTRSDTFASSTTALNQSGTLQIQVGAGAPVSVTINAGDDLTTIATNINKSGARVNASVLYDGQTYRLLVRGLDTGKANNVTFTENAVSLGLANPANTYQNASDATVNIDGVDVSRSTNVIAGAVTGVTFTLTNKMAAPGTVTIANDPTALATKIQSFVTAFNNMVSNAHFTAGYGTLKASDTALAGDGTMRSVLDRLQGIMSNTVAGGTTFKSLAAVGLHLQSDGSLTLDTTKLSSAITQDPDAVKRLFVTDATIGATGVMGTMKSAVDSLTTGTSAPLQARLDGYSKQLKSLSDEQASLQARLDQFQANLQAQFTQLEMQVSTYKAEGNSLASLGVTIK